MSFTIYAGLFHGEERAKKIVQSLEISGIKPQQITKHDVSHEENPNAFLVSVNANDKYDRQKTVNIFEFYKVRRIYELDKILQDEELKKLISAHANRHVLTNFDLKHRSSHHEGITSEVKFGS